MNLPVRVLIAGAAGNLGAKLAANLVGNAACGDCIARSSGGSPEDQYQDGPPIPLTESLPPKPGLRYFADGADRFSGPYAAAKLFGERLGQHYATTRGLEVIAVRIGWVWRGANVPSELPPERGEWFRQMWLSDRDFLHLMDCCLTAPLPQPFVIVNGMSANTGMRWDLTNAREALNYAPQDDVYSTRYSMRTVLSFLTLLLSIALFGLSPFVQAAELARKPNVIFILSDDLAQGDVGCYGQKLIKTPNLDRMATSGTRFTQAYSGTSVCAPSRTSLMIGKHMGHSPIRANREIQPEGQKPLPADTYTVARLFKDHGYATACVGKWGMGLFDTTGSPLKVGFDHFFGYNCQRHAHSYFPTFLYRDDQRFELAGNDGKTVGKTYAQNLIADETVKWVTANKDQPFFLYYSITLPHGRHEIDSQGHYKNEPWTESQKNYAAQVTRLDSDIGRLLDTLETLKLADNTLVIIAGDNGSSFAPNSEIGKLFDQTMGGKLRGFKRSLYEGGLRQACIARWPGVVPAGRVCDEPWAFWDFLPTCADILDARLPKNVTTDGVSILPLLKDGAAPKRDFFYWELHEAGPSLQAVRFGNWKGVKTGKSGAVELFDLKADPGESTDLATKHPDLVAKAAKLMTDAREDHPDWPLRDRAAKKN